MHMLGMHGTAFANYAVDDCDFLIALGARFDDRVAGVPAKFAPHAKLIAHLDIDASEINKVKRVDWSHVGDAARGAAAAARVRRGAAASSRDWSRAGTRTSRAQAQARDELRSRQPR